MPHHQVDTMRLPGLVSNHLMAEFYIFVYVTLKQEEAGTPRTSSSFGIESSTRAQKLKSRILRMQAWRSTLQQINCSCSTCGTTRKAKGLVFDGPPCLHEQDICWLFAAWASRWGTCSCCSRLLKVLPWLCLASIPKLSSTISSPEKTSPGFFAMVTGADVSVLHVCPGSYMWFFKLEAVKSTVAKKLALEDIKIPRHTSVIGNGYLQYHSAG